MTRPARPTAPSPWRRDHARRRRGSWLDHEPAGVADLGRDGTPCFVFWRRPARSVQRPAASTAETRRAFLEHRYVADDPVRIDARPHLGGATQAPAPSV